MEYVILFVEPSGHLMVRIVVEYILSFSIHHLFSSLCNLQLSDMRCP